jgi:hypothetical protein
VKRTQWGLWIPLIAFHLACASVIFACGFIWGHIIIPPSQPATATSTPIGYESKWLEWGTFSTSMPTGSIEIGNLRNGAYWKVEISYYFPTSTDTEKN